MKTDAIIIKKVFVVFFLLVFLSPCIAQKMSVAKFYLAENDLTANREGTIVYDQNGEKCALIKVETTQRGFTFDGGSLGITKVEERPSEIWLYVPHSLKRLTISHPQLGILRNHDLGVSVQKARTYILQLTTDRVVTAVFDDTRTQILELNVFPTNATVILNGVRETADAQGRIIKELSFGAYNCRIMADNYHPHERVITINDVENRHVVNVSLKQAFGYLQVISEESEFKGAEVFIDDNKVGTLPMNNIPVKSGTHRVTITNPLYLPYEASVTIQDSTVCQLRPDKLISNHAIVTINVANASSIWVDNVYKGEVSWIGPLAIGTHIVECRKEGHRTTTKRINVVSTDAVVFNCESPKLITPQSMYGTLDIKSIPNGIDVLVNGKRMGQTPFYSSQMLPGKYELSFSKDGYKTESRSVEIKESETQELSVELSQKHSKTIFSHPSKASVYLDNEYKGTTPYTIQTEKASSYNLRLTYLNYKDYEKVIKVGNDEASTMNIVMEKEYSKSNRIKSKEIYGAVNYRTMGISGVEAVIGFYLHNFNVEFGALWCTDASLHNEHLLKGYMHYGSYEFKNYTWSLRMGGGIRLGNRVRITPQLALDIIPLSDTGYSSETTSSVNVGLCAKFDYVVNSWFGLSATPEYNYNLDNIGKSVSGFNFRLGMYVYY